MSWADFYGTAPRKKKSKKKGYVIIKGKAYPMGSGSMPKKHKARPKNNDYGYGSGNGFGSMYGKPSRSQKPESLATDYYATGRSMYNAFKSAKQGPVGQFVGKKIVEYKAKRSKAKAEKQAQESRNFMGVKPLTKDEQADQLRSYMGY